MVLDSFTLSFYAVARGLHNLSYESIGVIIFQLVVLVFGISALKAGLELEWIISSVALAAIINFSFSASVVRWKYKIKLKPEFDKQFIKILLAITVPFALFAIFQRIYMYQDTVLLSVLAGDRYVGLYQVAFKIIFALQFLPMAFVASLYPALSSYWKSNQEQLGITFERALRYLLIIALPISAGIISLADRIIALFKPEYIEAVLPLQITMIALIFIFLNFPIGSLLNACDRQAINTRNMGIALVSSLALNFVLIPFFQKNYGNGAIGAGITVVFTNFLMFALGLYYVPQILDWSRRRRQIFSIVWRVLLSVTVMSALVIWLKIFINVFAVIIIGAFVYGGIMFLIGGIKMADIQSVLGSLRRT
jgi:O-antigen/teichoic acid export membrane protein